MTSSIETQTQVTVANCNAQLDAGFAAWLLALGVRVESISASGEVVMRMPFSDAITRQPGIVCGQAIMSLIDTCMVMVCWAGMGRIGNCTTVNQNTNFTRAAGAGDGKDLGMALEFKSEIKFSFDIFQDSKIGYSYSHISNNDWGDKNPGVDNQTISFSKTF